MAENSATGTEAAEDLEEHRSQPITDVADLPAPSMQPDSLPSEGERGFSTTEILWWNNGIWGRAGYAIPNDGGKPTTKNSTIWGIHAFLGRELFSLMHRPDVKFRRPPNSEWLHRIAKMIRLGRKRMLDRSVGFNDERKGDADHVTTNVQNFLIFPTPFFGGRLGNSDAREWTEIMLILLGEIMQHSDNGFDGDITNQLAAKIDEQLRRIEFLLATKYLGVTRDEANAGNFSLPEVIGESNYHPDNLFTESEMINERPPIDWWPTANDLSPIATGVPASIAKQYAMRWPIAGIDFYGDQHAHERAYPGGSTGPGGTINRPGSRAAEG